MSHVLDRLNFLKRRLDKFSNSHGEVVNESRKWEDAYRARWQFDKIVRSTHGVNCTGSCSWKIYVKNGLITWETQQTDYPRTRPDLPNHEPRGCPRGASYSWYVYSAQRLKYPMLRGRLAKLWREARKTMDPIKSWEHISQNPKLANEYKQKRGLGGFVRSNWDEVQEIIAAANVYTIKNYGPDRVFGFSPIPAMSMISYSSGARYLGLIGGVPLSFYDWYCDLPPASPQVWGEQTDVAESADWYNSGYLIVWGSNIPMTRTPDAHFYTEVRYKGTKTVAVSSDYGEMVKFGDIWLAPKQGTDSALAMAMGHVILKEYHLDSPSDYFVDYCSRYTDFPNLVILKQEDDDIVPSYYLRASHLIDTKGETKNLDWKTVVVDKNSGKLIIHKGSIGFRWDKSKSWNLKAESNNSEKIISKLSLLDQHDEIVPVTFPYFGGSDHNEKLVRNVPAIKVKLNDDSEVFVATVFDLSVANYGIDRGIGGDNVAKSYDDDVPYTPAWQEKHTGVNRKLVIQVAKEFALNADQTHGKSMVIVGAALNHWFHMDMTYRGIINMLMMCGCIGQSGGGWAHYVGQEKLRPQTGWTPLAFALDWVRPPRQMNGTSFFYAHTSQWRHEKIPVSSLISPAFSVKDKDLLEMSMIDYNAKAERMGWLPSAPQLSINPLEIASLAKEEGKEIKDYIVDGLKSGKLDMACNDPDNPKNFPRNLFVWRSNILGSSGKGHEYFLKYLLGTQNAVICDEKDCIKPKEIKVRPATKGKLDLLVVLDFRMSSTCLFADVILPTATWYEKDDMNTSDMHPFIHPLSEAVQPLWQSKTDWEIYKGIVKKFSELSKGYLGKQTDVILTPLMHDTPQEISQPFDVQDWKKGECDPIPGKTMPAISVVERDYDVIYDKYITIGPLLEKVGNGGKGISWDTKHEVDFLRKLNKTASDGIAKGQPKIEYAIDACEMILTLAPETNGHVAVKAWDALSQITGIDHTHLAKPREHDSIRFRDIQVQPRKIISSPTWSGLESEDVSYNAGYTNVHELIPWRTVTGRQQFYQDHPWMRMFGEHFCVYKPPINMKTIDKVIGKYDNGNKEVVLNFITPHQKWGIHSTYSDNLRMLTLSRGGPHVWISEIDAKKVDIIDNDWVELFNVNGTITARVVVSQRVPEGMVLMYHAQERLVNIPGSEISGKRGGINNSVTRTILKPTHMIGGCAQLSWGFNYYGTVGCNRDEYVVLRKMNKIDWKEKVVSREYQ